MSTVKQEVFTIQDFKNLLVNRAEIEKILGITINPPIDTEKQYLKDYSMFEYINLEDVIAIFLGLNPNNYKARNNHPRYWTIYKAIETVVRNGTLTASVVQDFDINGNEIQYDIRLSHETAKQWAKTYGLEWNVEPYKEITQNTILLQNTTNQEQIAELQARIDELEKENESLKQDKSRAVVNYDDCSIYGHSTPSIKALFGTIKRFWLNADITQPDTVENVAEIEQWIADNYSVSKTLKGAIQKIARPEEARYLGRKS
ncbi:TPA: hypothetical protein ACY38A_000961 [Pasteurella multocida]